MTELKHKHAQTESYISACSYFYCGKHGWSYLYDGIIKRRCYPLSPPQPPEPRIPPVVTTESSLIAWGKMELFELTVGSLGCITRIIVCLHEEKLLDLKRRHIPIQHCCNLWIMVHFGPRLMFETVMSHGHCDIIIFAFQNINLAFTTQQWLYN